MTSFVCLYVNMECLKSHMIQMNTRFQKVRLATGPPQNFPLDAFEKWRLCKDVFKDLAKNDVFSTLRKITSLKRTLRKFTRKYVTLTIEPRFRDWDVCFFVFLFFLINIYFQEAFSQSDFLKGPELNKQI